MQGVNKVIIVGTLGREPEVKYFDDGAVVCNMAAATSEKWKDKTSGEQKEKTEWHRLVARGRTGEICGKYLKKGSKAYFEGKLQTRAWEKDGQKHYATEVLVFNVQFLDSPSAKVEPHQVVNQKGKFARDAVEVFSDVQADDLPF